MSLSKYVAGPVKSKTKTEKMSFKGLFSVSFILKHFILLKTKTMLRNVCCYLLLILLLLLLLLLLFVAFVVIVLQE